MEIEPNRQVSATSINYDDQPIVQAQIDGVDYRVDTGLGSAVAISSREAGTWAWTPVAEGRWDGRRLRARKLDHPVASRLGEALAEAMSQRDEQGFA
jgi:hypothetical protein